MTLTAGRLVLIHLVYHNKISLVYHDFHGDKTLRGLVELNHPGAFFLVTPYTGFIEKSCSDTFERGAQDWPRPALAAPVHDSTLKGLLRAPGCHFLSVSAFGFPPTMTEAEKAKELADLEDRSSGVAGNALL